MTEPSTFGSPAAKASGPPSPPLPRRVKAVVLLLLALSAAAVVPFLSDLATDPASSLRGTVFDVHRALSDLLEKQAVQSAVQELVSEHGRVRIVHVVNVYPDVDEDRALVLESMEGAKDNPDCVGDEIDVRQIAAIRPGDEAWVPPSFDGRYGLYEFHEDRYPSLRGIFEGAQKHFEWDYMVFTNSDIVLHPYFYCTVRDIILSDARDAFAINRKTVPKDTTLEEIASGRVRGPTVHPGHDTWVMTREVWSKFSLGHTYIAWHHFSREMLVNMLHFAKRPHVYESFDVVNGTYHRGDDRQWEDFAHHPENVRLATDNIVNQLCGEENNYHVICDHPKNQLIKKWCKAMRGFEDFDVRKWCATDPPVVHSFT